MVFWFCKHEWISKSPKEQIKHNLHSDIKCYEEVSVEYLLVPCCLHDHLMGSRETSH